MVLQAAIDDSGNAPDQHTFVLAGFLATSEQWAAFSEEWDAELKREPALDYFKFKEAVGLKDQFDPRKGWTGELCIERVERLALIIRKHVIARFHATIQHAHFQEFFRSVPVPSRQLLSDHPYILLFGRMLTMVAQLMVDLKLSDTCDFYFDSQDGFDAEVMRMWPITRDIIGSAPGRLLKGAPKPPPFGAPTFRSEKEFLPLQAADMIAGTIRDASMTGTAPRAVKSLEGIPSLGFVFTEDEVKRVGRNLMDFVSRHPGPLVPYDPATARRLRKKERRNRRL